MSPRKTKAEKAAEEAAKILSPVDGGENQAQAQANEQTPPAAPEETREPQTTKQDPVSAKELSGEDAERKERLKSIMGTVGDKTFEFPVGSASIQEATTLAFNFIEANLVDGQIFSINPQRRMMLDIPECGIELSFKHPTWTYKEGTLDSMQLRMLLGAVNSMGLLVGDIGLSLKDPVEEKTEVEIDSEGILDGSMMQIFEKVGEIVNSKDKQSHRKLEILRVYETKNLNRPEILRLLESAVNEIPGALGLQGDNPILDDAEKQYDERMAQGHFNPIASEEGNVDVSKVM